jgi:hypothetical protein
VCEERASLSDLCELQDPALALVNLRCEEVVCALVGRNGKAGKWGDPGRPLDVLAGMEREDVHTVIPDVDLPVGLWQLGARRRSIFQLVVPQPAVARELQPPLFPVLRVCVCVCCVRAGEVPWGGATRMAGSP